MIDAERHGFQLEVEKLATGGYAELNCGVSNFNERVVEAAKSLKPDIIFLQLQSDGLTMQAAYELSTIGFTMQWNGDKRQTTPDYMIKLGQQLHLTLFSNGEDVLECKRLGIKADWLECGFEPERYRLWENPLPAPEIVAHFNCYNQMFPLSQYRRDIVERLRGEFGQRFGVYGTFPGANGSFNHSQVEESRNYAGAKIAINCSHFNCYKYSSDRLSRITGTGGALALSHEFPGLNEMYPDGCIATFRDLDHLVDRCHYYLRNEEERRQMVAAAQKHALENYSFSKMAERIVQLYHEHKNKQ